VSESGVSGSPGTPLPDNNPKTRFGSQKPAFNFTPPVAEMVLGQAMRNGGQKYGAMNWRKNAVSSSIYYDAARRHLAAWLDGEDIASDSGVHHLGHVMACCAIILDAAAQGNLKDDRPIKGKFADEAAKATTPIADPQAPRSCRNSAYDAGATALELGAAIRRAEAPKFKVGDRVRATFTTPIDIGIGEVLDYKTTANGDRVKVRWERGIDGDNWYSLDGIVLAPKPKFKVGDRVRCACAACRGVRWRSAISGTIKSIDGDLLSVAYEEVPGQITTLYAPDTELAP
jgi:hypothetical protein